MTLAESFANAPFASSTLPGALPGFDAATTPIILAPTPPAARQATPHRASVLHVINGEHYSGAERVQDLLADRLPHLGYEVGFACVKPKLFPEKRQSRSAPVFSLNAKARADFQMARWLAAIARDGKYALLHAHTPRSLFIGAVASCWSGLPLVYHVHSPTSRDTAGAWKNWAKTQTERFGLLATSKIICVSRSLREHMLGLGHQDQNISVVHNGVPTRDDLPLRSPRGYFTFGSMALMRPRKGIEVLIEALAILRRQRTKPFRFRAVGPFESRDYEAALKSRANALGVDDLIDWTGFRGNVHAELDQMDALVLPSLYGEGLPMVVLEAMSSAVPVIASDVEGVVEAIDDGVEGALVPPGDAKALASRMAQMLDGDFNWSRMATAARARHAAHFSAERMAEGVAKVYDDLISTTS